MTYRIDSIHLKRMIVFSITALIAVAACVGFICTAGGNSPAAPEPPAVTTPAVDDNQSQTFYYITDSERNLIERIVAAEARGESAEGQAAVAQVIYCRATWWGQSINDVCTARGQFAKPYQGTISQTTKEAVSRIFDKGEMVLAGGATHFYAHKVVTPSWAKSKEFVARIGNHTFMR